ncbi:MAG: hypothetical protein HY820_00595 [Acidobacteria bacterium]|nr:hypothetical protein [Acidobacteriota bacterium]
MRPRLRTALGLLAGIAMMAMMTLDGRLRAAVLLLLSGLGLKLWIAELKRKQEAAEEKREGGAGSIANEGDGRQNAGDR